MRSKCERDGENERVRERERGTGREGEGRERSEWVQRSHLPQLCLRARVCGCYMPVPLRHMGHRNRS